MRAAVFCVALSLAACDPRDFDRAVEKAPVRSIQAPDGYKSPDIGRTMLPLPPPAGQTKVTGRLLVAGSEQPSLALLDFDAAGHVNDHVASGPTVSEAFLDKGAPIGSAARLADGKILLGTPNFGVTALNPPLGRTLILDIGAGPNGAPTFTISPHLDVTTAQTRFGLAVATGSVAGGAAEDQIIVSENQVALLTDGDLTKPPLFSNADACDITLETILPTAYSFRALAVGDLIEGGGDEIAVGVPHDVLAGKVVIFQSTLDCPVVITPPALPNQRLPKFGAFVSLVDLDGDGKRSDLIVGSPGDGVFVYQAPFTAGVSPVPVRSIKPMSAVAGDFGFRAPAFDVDGLPGPELMISAPDTTVGGKAGAGQLFIYKPDGTLLTSLADKDPDDRAAYGTSVAQLSFAAPACAGGTAGTVPLLVVGGVRELFTYFRLPASMTRDPRCFTK